MPYAGPPPQSSPATFTLDQVNTALGKTTFTLADVNRRLKPILSVPTIARGERDQTELERAHREYEARYNIFDVGAHRLESGYQNLRAGGSAVLAANEAGTLRLFDAIDAGRHPRELVDALPSLDRDAAFRYFGAGPDERAEMRSEVERGRAEGAETIAAARERQAEIPRNPVVAATMEAANDFRFGDAWRAFSKDPIGFVGQVGTESVPHMAAGVALTPVLGPAAGIGVGSGLSEFGPAIVGGLADAGVDLTDAKAIEAALSDPALMATVRENALKRAALIGGFDAASGGLAGRVLAPSALTNPLARQAVNIPSQMLAGGTLGATGEGAAGVATGQGLQPGEMFAEFVGESFQAPGEVGAAALASGRSVTLEQVNAALKRRPGRPGLASGLAQPTPQAAPGVAEPQPAPSMPPAATPPSGLPAGMQGPSPVAPQQATPSPVESPPMVAPPQKPSGAPVAAPIGTQTVATPAGRQVEAAFELVDAGSLIASTTPDGNPNPAYPQGLQPRDRSRAVSGAQIADIAANLNPSLLGASPTASDGAPIVGPDNVVESGNGRTLAILRAYQQNMPSAQRYRDWLASQGYDTNGMAAPILVRRRTTELSPAAREAFTRESNARTTLAMSASEQAKADAANVTGNLMGLYAGGDLGAAGNRRFVTAFMETINPADRGALVTPEGALSQEGRRRLENAMFARAYSNTEALTALRESGDVNFAGIGNALVDAAPAWAKLRADVATGRVRPEMEITQPLMAALETVRDARRRSLTVGEVVREVDAFRGETPEMVRRILRLFFNDDGFKRPASRQRVAAALSYYAEQAGNATTDAGLGLDVPQADPGAILDLAPTRGDRGMFDGTTAASRSPRLTPAENEARGKAAVGRVILTKKQEPAAMIRDDVGSITFDYGEPGTKGKAFQDGWGLSHIIARRNLDNRDGFGFVRDHLPRILARGRLQAIVGPPTGRRALVDYKGERAVLSLFRHGQRESWVLTAYEKVEAGAGGISGVNPSTLRASGPRISPQAGAAPDSNVGPADPTGNDPDTLLSQTPGRTFSLTDVNNAMRGTNRSRMLASTAGSAYVGNVADVFDPTVPRSARDPIRRDRIIRKLERALGATVYTGRVKGKRTQGFFRPKTEEVRIKKANDIETATHELAHLLDYRFPEIRQQWHPATAANKAIRDELRSVSYDKAKLYEGFAEFVRLWATQTSQAQVRAPRFYAWFESCLDRNPHGAAFREAQKDMTAWFNQAAIDRARSKIGVASMRPDWLDSPVAHFRQSVTDDLEGIRRFETTMKGTTQPGGAYETARLTRGAAGIIEGALKFGVPYVKPDGSHGFRGKGLDEILKPVTDKLDDFLMYMVGRSASELHGQGRERLFSPSEIKAMLSLDTPEFRTAFAEYQQWNHGILDFAQDKGVINPFKRLFWQRTAYLPFWRVSQGNLKGRGRTSGEFTGIKSLTGGTENLRDVLGNIIGNAAMLIEAGVKNDARLKAADLASTKGGARFMVKIPPEDARVTVPTSQIERAILDALGVRSRNQLSPEMQSWVDTVMTEMGGMIRLVVPNQAPRGDNIVAAMRKGKPEYYEVGDPLLYRALTALNRPGKNWLVNLLAMPKNIGQATITLAPDFIGANIFRDTVAGAVFSKHGFVPFMDSARGLVDRLKNNPVYREYLANGGGFASHLLDEGQYRSHLKRFYTSKGIDYRTVLDAPDKLGYGLGRLAESFEVATRLGEFRRAIDAGADPRTAAFDAREVSTDFAMRGDNPIISTLYDIVIFLKAGVVSLDRAGRAMFSEPHKGRVWAKTALIAAASALLYAINRDNPLYDELEDWDRDVHWHFFVPTVSTIEAWSTGQPLPPLNERFIHLRLPRIWEVGAVGSIAERQLEGILNGQPLAAQGHTLRVLADMFHLDLRPQIVAPWMELYANRDEFTDRPIEPMGMETLQPWARSGAGGNRTLRALAEMTRGLPEELQFSPAQAEHLIRGYLNTYAGYGLSLIDAALFDDMPDARLDRMPVIRRFFAQAPAQNTRYVTELYEMIDAATAARRTMNLLARTWRPELAEETAYTADNALYPMMSQASGTMQAFGQFSKQVMEAPDLDTMRELATYWTQATSDRAQLGRWQLSRTWGDLGALKRQVLDAVTQHRNDYAKQQVGAAQAYRSQLEAGGALTPPNRQ